MMLQEGERLKNRLIWNKYLARSPVYIQSMTAFNPFLSPQYESLEDRPRVSYGIVVDLNCIILLNAQMILFLLLLSSICA